MGRCLISVFMDSQACQYFFQRISVAVQKGKVAAILGTLRRDSEDLGCYIGWLRIIKDIISLEKVQRRATKYILNKFFIDYRTRLKTLQLLPLMYWLEVQDLMFLIKCIKDPSDNFNIFSHITFIISTTRVSRLNHLHYNYCHSTFVRHFYLNRVASLWNSLESHIDLSLSIHTIKQNILTALWDHFLLNFDTSNPCTFHYICPCSSCSMNILTALWDHFLLNFDPVISLFKCLLLNIVAFWQISTIMLFMFANKGSLCCGTVP